MLFSIAGHSCCGMQALLPAPQQASWKEARIQTRAGAFLPGADFRPVSQVAFEKIASSVKGMQDEGSLKARWSRAGTRLAGVNAVHWLSSLPPPRAHWAQLLPWIPRHQVPDVPSVF